MNIHTPPYPYNTNTISFYIRIRYVRYSVGEQFQRFMVVYMFTVILCLDVVYLHFIAISYGPGVKR